jgi:16S rRNA (adenine1518-N6/adenine1519-N6)-dimethyltransferase
LKFILLFKENVTPYLQTASNRSIKVTMMAERQILPIHIPHLLRKYHLRPDKRLGQSFLMDESALGKIMQTADISAGELVLEIGPGLGSLTRHLAVKAGQVIAVELDKRLLPPLHEVLSPYPNVLVVQGDILEQEPESLLLKAGEAVKDQVYVVVANIPYYITSAVIQHLLESPTQPDRVVLTVQKEVALRICAHPPDMSILALSVQVFGSPQVTAKISPGAFYPPPKVDSAVLRIDIYDSPVVPMTHLDTFFRLVKAGFSQKRKTLRNSLSSGLGISKVEAETLLAAAEIDHNRRAETLSLLEWRKLTAHYQD